VARTLSRRGFRCAGARFLKRAPLLHGLGHVGPGRVFCFPMQTTMEPATAYVVCAAGALRCFLPSMRLRLKRYVYRSGRYGAAALKDVRGVTEILRAGLGSGAVSIRRRSRRECETASASARANCFLLVKMPCSNGHRRWWMAVDRRVKVACSGHLAVRVC